jgi:thiamine biosynthesis lipoprotein ApbE
LKTFLLTLNLIALCGTLTSGASCSTPGNRGSGAVQGDAGKGDFYTTNYLSKINALHTVFPDARRVLVKHVRISAAERDAIEKLLRGRIRQGDFTVYVGVGENNELDGYAIIQDEIGKFKLFTFIVGVEPDGTVRRVATLVYRESRGGGVARRRFASQYDGKSVKSPLSINRDIKNISGATMSVNSMNHGVKKVLAAVDVLFRQKPERLHRVLDSGQDVDGFADTAANDRSEKRHETWNRARESRLLMGSLCEIELWGKNPDRLGSALRQAFREIERIDKAISDYRPGSDLSRISAHAGGTPIRVCASTYAFLEQGLALARASRGALDLTIGPAVDAWGFRGNQVREPSATELDVLARLVDYRQIELQKPDLVRLGKAGMRLDPGALGKGYTVDRAVEILIKSGVQKALVNFSGTIYALGFPPDREAWSVAIRDPARPDRILGRVSLKDEAIASSGSYEKFVDIDGARLGHILSPTTLRPVSGVLGTTVRARSATLADGWSTALAVMGVEGLRDLDRQRDSDGPDSEGLSGLVVTTDGVRTRSSSWPSEWQFDLSDTQETDPTVLD